MKSLRKAMEKPKLFAGSGAHLYKKVQYLDKVTSKHRKALEKQQSARLLFGMSSFALLVLSQMLKGYYLELIAILFTLPLYLYYFIQSRREQRFLQKLTGLKAFYNRQIAIRAGEKIEQTHSAIFPNSDLSRDLDLQEFFPYIDQTLTLEGEYQLMSELTGSTSHTLAEKHQWLQEVAAYPGLLRKLHTLSYKEKINLKDILETLQISFLPEKSMSKWLLLFLWVSTIALVFINAPLAKYTFIPFILITLQYLQQTHALFSRLQSLQIDLAKLEPIFAITAQLPQQKISFLPTLMSSAPQRSIKKIKNYVSLQSFRANPFVYYLINFMVPWSLIINELTEKQRKIVLIQFQDWKKELTLFEVISSLATIYIYQTKTLPKISTQGELSCQNIIHPLLGSQKAITNSFSKEPQKSLFLITGSNMSGKSTFLRSVGINYCLARMGAPVWADEFIFPNSELITCIRVSDSLRDGKSYFFSEVLRLKKILTLAKEKRIFFLIDEPLKGTNNRERLAGNQAFLQQLVETKSLGFIATHDLDLTSLENKIVQLQNFHFTESWKNDELYFDYKIKSGPSESTNALKIMQREGLVPQV